MVDFSRQGEEGNDRVGNLRKQAMILLGATNVFIQVIHIPNIAKKYIISYSYIEN